MIDAEANHLGALSFSSFLLDLGLENRRACPDCAGLEEEYFEMFAPLFRKKKTKKRQMTQSLVKRDQKKLKDDWDFLSNVIRSKNKFKLRPNLSKDESQHSQDMPFQSQIRKLPGAKGRAPKPGPGRQRVVTDLQALCKESPFSVDQGRHSIDKHKLIKTVQTEKKHSELNQDIIRFSKIKDTINRKFNLKPDRETSGGLLGEMNRSEGTQRESRLGKWLRDQNGLNLSEERPLDSFALSIQNKKEDGRCGEKHNEQNESPEPKTKKRGKHRLSFLKQQLTKYERKQSRKKHDQTEWVKRINDNLHSLLRLNILHRKLFIRNKSAVMATCFQPTIFNIVNYDKIIPKILPVEFVSEKLNFILKMLIVLNKKITLYQVVIYLLISSYTFVQSSMKVVHYDRDEENRLYFQVKRTVDDKPDTARAKPTQTAPPEGLSAWPGSGNEKASQEQLKQPIFRVENLDNEHFSRLVQFMDRVPQEQIQLMTQKFFQLESLKIEEAALKFGFRMQRDFDNNFFRILSRVTDNHTKFFKVVATLKEVGQGFFDLDSSAQFFAKNGGFLSHILAHEAFAPGKISRANTSTDETSLQTDLNELVLDPHRIKRRMELALFAFVRKFKNLPSAKEQSSSRYEFDR